jgi:hypothetical protein
VVEIVADLAAGLLLDEAGIDAIGRGLLESHVAIVAWPHPGALQRAARVAIETASGRVDRVILPRPRVAGLTG